eukprot:XP_001693728.1 HMGB protein [Chlamydomonas reinhardtii]
MAAPHDDVDGEEDEDYAGVLPGVPIVSGTIYPPASEPQEAVINDPKLFWSTLRELHKWLGTHPLRVPTVSGQELDLYLLYKQVCEYGGVLQVISEKKWSEVCDPFNFSKSFTSKSWTIRRLYCQLLWHYEQPGQLGPAGGDGAEVPFLDSDGGDGGSPGYGAMPSPVMDGAPLGAAPASTPTAARAAGGAASSALVLARVAPQGYQLPPPVPQLLPPPFPYPPALVAMEEGLASSEDDDDGAHADESYRSQRPPEPGDVFTGTVSSLFDTGCFVTIRLHGRVFRGMLPPPAAQHDPQGRDTGNRAAAATPPPPAGAPATGGTSGDLATADAGADIPDMAARVGGAHRPSWVANRRQPAVWPQPAAPRVQPARGAFIFFFADKQDGVQAAHPGVDAMELNRRPTSSGDAGDAAAQAEHAPSTPSTEVIGEGPGGTGGDGPEQDDPSPPNGLNGPTGSALQQPQQPRLPQLLQPASAMGCKVRIANGHMRSVVEAAESLCWADGYLCPNGCVHWL